VRDVAKYFASVNALQDISLKVYAGEVTCVLGDNGAGNSTLIKILSGVFPPDAGEFLIEGQPVLLAGPREARAHGIATVFQDLATLPLTSLWRNFFLGQEPTTGRRPLRRLNTRKVRTIMREELLKMGIDVRDPNQNVGTLSGGERQALAIARAVYFGARATGSTCSSAAADGQRAEERDDRRGPHRHDGERRRTGGAHGFARRCLRAGEPDVHRTESPAVTDASPLPARRSRRGRGSAWAAPPTRRARGSATPCLLASGSGVRLSGRDRRRGGDPSRTLPR
jgi:ABC-type lipoprotein export system ATPase subunit